MNGEKRKTLLLVEDEAIIAIAQKQTLVNYGYNVITAGSGEKALELFINRNDVDLILMDIDLGKGIDGTETATMILKEKTIPIVFLSSHTEPEVVEKTEKITSYGYVVKNSGITVLDASIKMAFKLFEANRTVQDSESIVRKKLDAITDPEGDIGDLNLSDIIDYQALQIMMEDFNRINKIGGSAILDISGNVLVAAGWQDICTKFHRINSETAANCLESDVNLASGVPMGTAKAYRCKNNMWDMVTPIEIGGRHLGNIFLGQFFYDDEVPDYETFRGQARKCGFNEKEYIKALDEVPRISRETAEAAMSFFARLAGMISSLSYNKVKLSRALAQKNAALMKITDNELKQNIMISNISDVIAVVGADGIVNYKSPNIEKWFGWGETDLIGSEAWQTVHPDDLQLVQKEFYTLLEQKNASVTLEYRYKCKDGSYKPIELTAVNLTGDPSISGILMNFHDMTGRKKIEDEIKSKNEELAAAFEEMEAANEELTAAMEELDALNEELISTNDDLRKKDEALLAEKILLSVIIESASEAIFVKDLSGRYLIINETGAGMLGYKKEEIIGRRDVDLISAEAALEFRKTDEWVMSSGNVYEREEIVNINGSDFVFLAHKSPLFNASGEIAGVIGLTADITERKMSEDKINNLLSEKELILKEVHHRVRNYMNTINALIILQAEALKDPIAIAALEDTGHRVRSMILLYEKLYQTADFKSVSVQSYLPSLVDEIINNFPGSKTVKIEKKISDFILEAKKIQPLGIIINELLTNTMKYAFSGIDNGLITVAAQLEANHAVFVIEDNGIGIPESIDFGKSTGFGLDLVRMLVEQTGGSIRIVRGSGAKFIIEFPV